MIDQIAELLKTGIVDRSGRFQMDLDSDRVRTTYLGFSSNPG